MKSQPTQLKRIAFAIYFMDRIRRTEGLSLKDVEVKEIAALARNYVGYSDSYIDQDIVHNMRNLAKKLGDEMSECHRVHDKREAAKITIAKLERDLILLKTELNCL